MPKGKSVATKETAAQVIKVIGKWMSDEAKLLLEEIKEGEVEIVEKRVPQKYKDPKTGERKVREVNDAMLSRDGTEFKPILQLNVTEEEACKELDMHIDVLKSSLGSVGTFISKKIREKKDVKGLRFGFKFKGSGTRPTIELEMTDELAAFF